MLYTRYHQTPLKQLKFKVNFSSIFTFVIEYLRRVDCQVPYFRGELSKH